MKRDELLIKTTDIAEQYLKRIAEKERLREHWKHSKKVNYFYAP